MDKAFEIQKCFKGFLYFGLRLITFDSVGTFDHDLRFTLKTFLP